MWEETPEDKDPITIHNTQHSDSPALQLATSRLSDNLRMRDTVALAVPSLLDATHV